MNLVEIADNVWINPAMVTHVRHVRGSGTNPSEVNVFVLGDERPVVLRRADLHKVIHSLLNADE